MLIPDEFTGELDRRAITDVVRVPADIRIADDRLEWQIIPVSEVRPTAETLSEFVKLAEADSERIAEFARKWGVL